MARAKNTPKKESFMDELEEASETSDSISDAEENIEESSQAESPVKNKRGLSSIPMTLKRVRKIVEGVNVDDISIADEFDLKMTSGYIDFLKKTVDNMLEAVK